MSAPTALALLALLGLAAWFDLRRRQIPNAVVAAIALLWLAALLRSLAVADAERAAPAGRKLTWDADASPALRPENQPRSSLAVMRGDTLETVSVRSGAGS